MCVNHCSIFKNKPVIFLDIDSVLALEAQFNSNNKKWNKEYNRYYFDSKCVKVLNQIIEVVNPIIILSSDWKDKYSIKQMNRIFEINKINSKIFDNTVTLWGTLFNDYKTELELCRATEILIYVNKYDIGCYVAIDDLDLKHWIPNNFIHITRIFEGIKQSGLKEKIITKLNNN